MNSLIQSHLLGQKNVVHETLEKRVSTKAGSVDEMCVDEMRGKECDQLLKVAALACSSSRWASARSRPWASLARPWRWCSSCILCPRGPSVPTGGPPGALPHVLGACGAPGSQHANHFFTQIDLNNDSLQKYSLFLLFFCVKPWLKSLKCILV